MPDKACRSMYGIGLQEYYGTDLQEYAWYMPAGVYGTGLQEYVWYMPAGVCMV